MTKFKRSIYNFGNGVIRIEKPLDRIRGEFDLMVIKNGREGGRGGKLKVMKRVFGKNLKSSRLVGT